MQQINQKQITNKIFHMILLFSFFISTMPSFSQDAEVESGAEYIIPDEPKVEFKSGKNEHELDESLDTPLDKPKEKIEDTLEEKTEEKPLDIKPEIQARKILKGHVSKIPTGTKFKIIVETPISEESSVINDEIQAKVLKDIYVKNQFAVPAGSIVTGVISDIVPSKKLHKAGRAKIEFKDIKTPDGLHIPISAITLHKGVVKGKYTKKTGLISAGSILGPIAAGAGAGVLVDSSPIGIGLGAAAGAVVGLGLFLFEKGNKLSIKAGDKLSVELIEDAIIPEDDGRHEHEKESIKAIDEEKKLNKEPEVEIKNFDDVDEVKEEN